MSERASLSKVIGLQISFALLFSATVFHRSLGIRSAPSAVELANAEYLVRRVHWSSALEASGREATDVNLDTFHLSNIGKPDELKSFTWKEEVGEVRFERIKFLLDTGGTYFDKGLYALSPSEARLLVNGKVVSRIVLDVRGKNAQFWSTAAPAGARFVATEDVDIARLDLAGPALEISLELEAGASIDIHSLEIVAATLRSKGG